MMQNNRTHLRFNYKCNSQALRVREPFELVSTLE